MVQKLIELAATLKEEDLHDPAIHGQVSQLVSMLDEPSDIQKSDLEKASPGEITKSHILMFPVSINGKNKDEEGSGVDYHTTLKVIGSKPAHSHEQIQDVVNRYNLEPPKDVEIEPHILNSHKGPVHTLRIKNASKSWAHAHHDLSEENPSMYKQFVPHITVSKELHDKVKEENLTAKDIGLKFHPLQYRVGADTVKEFTPIPKATESFTKPTKLAASEVAMSDSKIKSLVETLKKNGHADLAEEIEREILVKGQDENGTPVKGSNKRLQQAKVFGKPSDAKKDKKGVWNSKIPDANGERTSPQRMKMMNAIKDYASKKMGANMVVAEGKRDETGKLKAKASIEKQPFDVFTPQGHADEKSRSAKIKDINAKKPKGEKPIKRVDPKPDHRSGNLETQPSPDAAVHEIAHEHLAPEGMTMAQHQTHMDKQWGESQSKHGHMQQKKTAGEVQPMAAENKVRREIGLPANRTGQKVKDASKPVDQTVDGTGPRFNRAKDKSGKPTDLMRQTRLLSPENKQRIEKLRDGRMKHTKDGIKPGASVDAKINARAAQAKPMETTAPKKEAPKANVSVVAAKPKVQKPEKLAASELARGMSYNDMKKAEKKS